MNLINTHWAAFRRGEPAEIIGLEMVEPEGLEPRFCYRVLYPDQVEDLVAMEDFENFEICENSS